jgi:hypothetical protein
MQAQDLLQARWALGVRAEGATARAVDEAFASAEVVRTWPMRGTLHVVAAEDAKWLLGLFARRNVAGAARRRRELGIDDDDLRAATRIAERALADGPISRDALYAALARGGQGVDGQRGYHLLWHLAEDARIVLAGEEVAWLEQWVRSPRALEGDEALGELATRYRRGHGPTTVEDLARWSGLPKGEASRAFEIAGEPPAFDDVAIPSALLLPGFDEYYLGYRDHSGCIAAEHTQRVVPGNNGIYRPIVVLGGRVRGTWSRKSSTKRMLVTVTPFAKLTAKETRAIEGEAMRLGAFFGEPVELAFADVA